MGRSRALGLSAHARARSHSSARAWSRSRTSGSTEDAPSRVRAASRTNGLPADRACAPRRSRASRGFNSRACSRANSAPGACGGRGSRGEGARRSHSLRRTGSACSASAWSSAASQPQRDLPAGPRGEQVVPPGRAQGVEHHDVGRIGAKRGSTSATHSSSRGGAAPQSRSQLPGGTDAPAGTAASPRLTRNSSSQRLRWEGSTKWPGSRSKRRRRSALAIGTLAAGSRSPRWPR